MESLRKGQKLIVKICFRLQDQGYAITNDNIERELWNMSDREFYEMLNWDVK